MKEEKPKPYRTVFFIGPDVPETDVAYLKKSLEGEHCCVIGNGKDAFEIEDIGRLIPSGMIDGETDIVIMAHGIILDWQNKDDDIHYIKFFDKRVPGDTYSVLKKISTLYPENLSPSSRPCIRVCTCYGGAVVRRRNYESRVKTMHSSPLDEDFDLILESGRKYTIPIWLSMENAVKTEQLTNACLQTHKRRATTIEKAIHRMLTSPETFMFVHGDAAFKARSPRDVVSDMGLSRHQKDQVDRFATFLMDNKLCDEQTLGQLYIPDISEVDEEGNKTPYIPNKKTKVVLSEGVASTYIQSTLLMECNRSATCPKDEKKRIARVGECIKLGADINHKVDANGLTALIYTCISTKVHYELVDFLLKNGANPNLSDNIGITPLIAACRSTKVNYELVKLLLKSGADIDWPNNKRETPLYIACKDEEQPLVKFLLENGANPNVPDKDGNTPLMLMLASKNPNWNIIDILLENKADTNLKNKEGDTALILHCRSGYYGVVGDLLKCGADINLPNNKGVTALYVACSGEKESLVDILLENGANPNLPDINGKMPLHIACGKENIALIKSLLNHGAHINEPNKDGETPLAIACNRGNIELVTFLLDHGANASAGRIYGTLTPLMNAAYCGEEGIVDVLLSHITDLKELQKVSDLKEAEHYHKEKDMELSEEEKIMFGKSAIAMAIENGHSDIAEKINARILQLEKEQKGIGNVKDIAPTSVPKPSQEKMPPRPHNIEKKDLSRKIQKTPINLPTVAPKPSKEKMSPRPRNIEKKDPKLSWEEKITTPNKKNGKNIGLDNF